MTHRVSMNDVDIFADKDVPNNRETTKYCDEDDLVVERTQRDIVNLNTEHEAEGMLNR